ncbi:HNH endonuclease signature motif containing protein [uncultured Shewanella sp.]|uniref:HNH endonuclease n=1 Tax=uncultured Shewanella sp. TaxID=173975 RepID=UPI002606C057|nr:HNH endonuclease signature motif containing protein [uncultured Shewanella sp.]
MFVATFRGDNRRTRKYKSEKAAMKAIRHWLMGNQLKGFSVGLMGPGIEPNEFYNWEEIPFEEPKPIDFYSSQKWKALRKEALNKYISTCICCGRSAKDGAVMHVDHIKPRSKYPQLALDIDNLQILCDLCNLGKSDNDEA